jgi:hypothetical protein
MKLFTILIFSVFTLTNVTAADSPVFTPQVILTDPPPVNGVVSLSLPTDTSVTEVQFNSPNSIILNGPGKLILDGGIDVAPDNFDTITAPMTGFLTKTGEGTLTLSADIDEFSSVTVTQGTLIFDPPKSVGSLTVSAGATLIVGTDSVPEPSTFSLIAAGIAILFFIKIPLACPR